MTYEAIFLGEGANLQRIVTVYSNQYAYLDFVYSVLMKNLHRTKKVDQNITSVKDCRGRLSDRIDKVRFQCSDVNIF